MQYSDALYYLRRSSDDDAVGYKGYIYSGECGICDLKNILGMNVELDVVNYSYIDFKIFTNTLKRIWKSLWYAP